MSRIGNNPISIPDGVTVTVDKSTVTVKGPKGELHQQIDPDIIIDVSDGQVTFKRPTEQKRHKVTSRLEQGFGK